MTAALIADDSMHLSTGQQQQARISVCTVRPMAGSPLADPTLGDVDQAVDGRHEGR